MEIKNGALGYTLTLDNKQVQQILAQTRADFARTNEYAIAEMDKVQNKMSDIKLLGGSFLSIAAAKGFVTELIHVRGEFQQIENAIETITGSQDKMNSLMTEWKDLTLRSPFRLSEIAQSGKQLLAYGIEVEKVTDDIEMLGNIASGVSAPINDIAYLYGTLKTQGRAYQQDINQFTGRGIPIIKELAKQFGVAESEVRKLTEAGKIGFPEVEKALRAMTSEGGQFFNLIGKQATTLTGAVNRLKHEIELMFNEIGTDTEGLLSGGINVVTHLVENYQTLGKTLGVLITTYGAYKAALIVADVANTTEATMIKNSIDSLRTKSSVIAKNKVLEYDNANAILNTAKAEELAQKAIVKVSKENLDALKIDREKALAKLNAASNAKVAADIEVAAAQKQVNAYKDSIYIGKQREAQQRLEEATNKRNALAKDVNTASTEYNTVAEKTNTASKTLNANVSDLQSKKQAVAVAAKNADTIATTRLTFSQKLNVAWTELATAATNAWNASLLSNPIVLVTVGVAGLASTIYMLSRNIDGAKDAQDRFNDSQEKNSKDLDGFTQNIRSYIETIQDSTKTQSEQIQAYTDLSSLRTNSFKDLSIEEIKLLSVADAQSRINKEISIYKSNQINSNIKDLQNRIEELNKSLKDEINLWERMRLSDELQKTGSLLEEQLYTQEDINHANKLASMSKQEQIVYLTELINKYDENINKTKRIGDNLIQGTTFLNSANTATNLWNLSMSNVATNADYILNRIQGWKATLNSLTKDSDKALGKAYGDRNYTDWTTIRDNAVSKQRDLGSNKKETKEWQDLQKEIDEANNALKAWETTKTKAAKKPKTPKKSDDPVEIFKKQVQGMKDEYDRYVNYMNSDDIVLKATADFKFMSLKKQGGNYEEYLRNVQKQLANVTNKTKTQVKELQYVNDELAKIIDYNAFDKYKEGINEQVDSSENLLKVIGLLEEEKQKFANSTNQIEKDKFKFLDEKEIDVIKKTDDAAKSLIKTLTEEANPLDTINKKFDEEIELLKYKLEKAKTDIEKQKIQVNIDQVETKRKKALEDTPTNNAEYNQLLKDYQDYQVKKETLEKQFSERLKTVQKARKELQDSEELKADKDKLDKMLAQNTATENEILKQKKNAISKINLEQLQSSDSYIRLLTEDMERMSLKTIRKIISDLENAMKDPNIGLQMNAQDIKIVTDQIQKLKDKAIQANPFKSLKEGWDSFLNSTSVDDKLKGLDKMNQAFDQIHSIVNSTLDIADSLGINVSDSTREAVELGAELFDAGSQIAEGVTSGNPVQVIQGIAKAAKSILSFGDKKKQRQIAKYQQAVDDLARSFKNLQYETSKALGSDTYKDQRAMLDNLTQQQNEYRKMIQTEQRRKKTDQGKIKEWQQAIVEIDQAKQDLLDSLAQDVLQTNAKDLASTLGDALVEAFGKGEDAAKSFEKVANDVLKNAVLNQLKKKFLEDQLQTALDQLYKDMGADNQGNFNFDGLTQAEQQKFKDAIKQISQNFSGALEMYSDLFKDLETDPNQNSLSGAIAGVSEETASIISGQMNAVRILIADANKQRDLSNKILLQQLDRLVNIDANTRVIEPLLNKLIDKIDKLGENRSYGF